MKLSKEGIFCGCKNPVEGLEASGSAEPQRKNYTQQHGSDFALSHLQSSPAEAKCAMGASAVACNDAFEEWQRSGRGRGEFSPMPLDSFLPTLTYPHSWSVAAANHPTLAAMRRYNEASASGRPARCVERVAVGYRPAPHCGGGAAQHPVGLRIRVAGGAGCPRDPLLVDAGTGIARKVNEVAPRRFGGAGTTRLRRSEEESPSVRSRSHDGGLVRSASPSFAFSGPPVDSVAVQCPLLSPLLQEVDMQLQRKGCGALSDIWAASPAAMDEVLAQGGFPSGQRETILWEMRRMVLAS